MSETDDQKDVADQGGEDALQELELGPEHAGRRLDQVLAELLPAFSRSRLQDWIAQGRIAIDGRMPRPKDRVRGAEQVVVKPLIERARDCAPQPIPLSVVYEDEHLLVVDKPAGLVVHPAAGHADGTLQNALLHHDARLDALPRSGIVHRLDKDTTGLMVVARTLLAHRSLVAQLKARTVKRDYRALVIGELSGSGRVDAPIGRHPTRRTAMAVVASGRPAVSEYRVLACYRRHTLLGVRLQTGRTHQIRVHFAAQHRPVLGDALYGPRKPRARFGLQRQFLHAYQLGFVLPSTGAWHTFESPLPDDLATALAKLRAAANAGDG